MQIHKRSKDRPRAIQYSHQSKHFDHGFTHNLPHKHCKESNKQSTKHYKANVKLDGDGTYLNGMKGMQKNETRVHKGSLILLPMVVPREAFDFFGEYGVKSDFTPPLLFFCQPCSPKRVKILFYFCKKNFAKFLSYHYYIYFPFKPYNYVQTLGKLTG